MKSPLSKKGTIEAYRVFIRDSLLIGTCMSPRSSFPITFDVNSVAFSRSAWLGFLNFSSVILVVLLKVACELLKLELSKPLNLRRGLPDRGGGLG